MCRQGLPPHRVTVLLQQESQYVKRLLRGEGGSRIFRHRTFNFAPRREQVCTLIGPILGKRQKSAPRISSEMGFTTSIVCSPVSPLGDEADPSF